MRFYVEEITVLNDGTSPVAIYEKGSELEAKSYFLSKSCAVLTPLRSCFI